jgi:hypothetical protein
MTMQRLKAIRLIISIAAMLFVAKPFLGFETVGKHFHPRQVHTILVKSFSKRKPESLQDADANVTALHHLLTNPLVVLLSSIFLLLLTLFPLLFKNVLNITGRLLSDIRTALLPPENACILTGQLLI